MRESDHKPGRCESAAPQQGIRASWRVFAAFLSSVVLASLPIAGCDNAPKTTRHLSGAGSRSADLEARDREPPATIIDARPVAIINGRRVDWGDIKAPLIERAGGEIIAEYALDQQLAIAIREAGITIDADTIAAERRRMLETLSDDPNTALRLLDELRLRQRLGSRRFEQLLRRNASLRALVRDQVQISESHIMHMYDALYGPRRQGRLITLPTLHDARLAIARIEQGELFADVAVDISTDASAARGGLLEPISLFDPSYPEALRRGLWGVDIGETSPPIMLDEQYAIVQLVAEFEGEDVMLRNVRDDLEERVRLNQERMLMDRLARELLNNSSFNMLDDALKESWNMRRRREALQE